MSNGAKQLCWSDGEKPVLQQEVVPLFLLFGLTKRLSLTVMMDAIFLTTERGKQLQEQVAANGSRPTFKECGGASD
jgi:hypothetical protein